MAIVADYSAAQLTGTALHNVGFSDAVRYAGTPGRTKNTTPAEVASLKAAGFTPHGVFENSTSDFSGGFAAGATNAAALLADAEHCGITGALFVSADQHLTAAQIVLWKQYLQGALSVLGARCGAYGFREAILAAQAVGVPILWQCGSRSDLVPGVHLYQRNTGGTTVSGIAVDVNDVINPIPAILGDVVALTADDIDAVSTAVLNKVMLATINRATAAGDPTPGGQTGTIRLTDFLAYDDSNRAVLLAKLLAGEAVTLTAAQFTTLTADVASAVDSAVGTLNLSVSPSDQTSIANAVATVLAARLAS